MSIYRNNDPLLASDINLKKITVYVGTILGVLAISGIVISYCTSDLNIRTIRIEERIEKIRQDTESKASILEFNLSINHIEKQIDEMKKSDDDFKKEIRELLIILPKR